MHSLIKKSTLIHDFRMQVHGKSNAIKLNFDKPFFEIINRVFKKKPHDIKFHITKQNTLVFRIKFNEEVDVYLEHFCDKTPDTLFSITHESADLETNGNVHFEQLNDCLDIIDLSLQQYTE